MGIKRKVSQTYMTDRGIEMEVKDMTPSHLVNAICHHQKQVEGLQKLLPTLITPSYMKTRIILLEHTIDVLSSELATRDPDKDYEEEKEESRTYIYDSPDY